MRKRVVFLDRDGVINRNSPEFIKSWTEFEFLPGSLDAMRSMTKMGFDLVLITNQSGIGRGLFSLATLTEMHTRMGRAVAARGGRILDIFHCPHAPEVGCSCRKPKPGMLYEARRRHGIDLSSAIMVGDSARDMECARSAGCKTCILVRSGDYRSARKAMTASGLVADYIADDLMQAAQWIIANRS
jgi:D-glycero-D-manno-heptose 1,7-bisphosphate phosphatase